MKSRNVLIVSTNDLKGGAAIAAYRLAYALNSSGINVTMLVANKYSSSSFVHCIGNSWYKRWAFVWERLKIFLYNRFSRKGIFKISIANTGLQITQTNEFKKADVIHLHWINQGMLSLSEIDRIVSSGKKIVWTLHDLWPITGICHLEDEYINYELQRMVGQVSHPLLNLIDRVTKKKHSIYSKGQIIFVACSKWLNTIAQKSKLSEGQRCVAIPNPIDTDIYHPSNHKEQIRKQLNIPLDHKVILFVADNVNDEKKGIKYLIEVSKLLASKFCKDELSYLIIGNKGYEIREQFTGSTVVLGYVSPDMMVEVYNAADVYVTPSLQDNLPNTIMEAMACGTPCVGFDIGGIPEMIEHNITGYIAEPKNVEDMAQGIYWCLYETDYSLLVSNNLKKVENEYAQEMVVKRYLDVYQSL